MPLDANQNKYVVGDFYGILKKSIAYLLTKKLLLGCLFFFFFGVGVFYAWIQKAEYVGTITYVAESDNGSKIGNYASIAAQFGLDVGQSQSTAFEGDNLNEVLRSRKLIEATLLTPIPNGISDKLMIDYYVGLKIKDPEVVKTLDFKKAHFERDRIRDSLISKFVISLQKKLTVERKDRKLSIVTLSLRTEDEFFTKVFIEQLTANAIKYYTDYKSKKSAQNIAALEKQADSLRQILFGNISGAASLNDLNVNPIKQAVKVGVQKKQIDIQISSVLYTEVLKNLEFAKLTARKETPLIQVIDSPILPLEKIKLGRLLGGIIFAMAGFFISVIVLLLKKIF